VTKRRRILVLAGFLLCLAALSWEFFVPRSQNANQTSSVPVARQDNQPNVKPRVPSLPSGPPQNPAQAQEIEKALLRYSPLPTNGAANTSPDVDNLKKKRNDLKTVPASLAATITQLKLPVLWQLCYVAVLGSTDVQASPPPDNDANFNPDPGAMLKPASAPLFPPTPGEPSAYGQGPLPPDLKLPRKNVNKPVKLQPHFDVPDYNKDADDEALPANTKAFPDRWKVWAPQWERYADPSTETAYQNGDPGMWLPFEQSTLKGDLPVFNQDVFFKITAENEESVDARNIPTPSGISAANPGSYEFYGQGDTAVSQNNTILTFDLFQGETAFRPEDWAIRLQPIINWNYTKVSENGVINANGLGGKADEGGTAVPPGVPANPLEALGIEKAILTPDPPENGDSVFLVRSQEFFTFQQAFFEYHIADISPNFDFVSFQGGVQPFNSDFRGFVFNDTNLGYRFFGNGDANRYQYNVAFFDEREKDTNSQLNNDLESRDQRVFIVNLYKQDFFEFLDDENLRHGYTMQASFLYNDDGADTVYDRNGFIVRPEPLGGPIAPHSIDTYYFGLNGDGHIGSFNLTNSFYEVLGHDNMNGLAGHPVSINAQEAAVELSYDFNWIRLKGSVFYASGDSNPTGHTATGFDSIVDNPNFIGSPFSYFVNNGFNLGGTAVGLKQDDSLLFNLRTSKTEGQSNFVNPGSLIYGIGADVDVTPRLKFQCNANVVSFVDPQPVEIALQTSPIPCLFGYDFSAGFFYRPLLTNNIVISAGVGAFLPGPAYRAIYDTNLDPVAGYDEGGESANSSPSFLYSANVGLTLVY